MVIKPKLKGSLALTNHPLGAKEFVKRQIDYVKSQGKYNGPKKVLIIGSSSGYGLASRISATFGAGADTIGVAFEKGIEGKRVGTAGWWNTIAFTEAAKKEGLRVKNFMGDAFSNEMKEDVIKYIKEEFGGKIDLLIYSLASAVRTDPADGVTYRSALKSTEKEIVGPSINLEKEIMEETVMGVATPEEIASTVKVMGGEDWQMWIDALEAAGVLADGVKTTAFTYLGEQITRDIYWNGSIGAAKKDLDRRVIGIRDRLAVYGGDARVSVLKAVVTQASSAIPMMPLYLSLLFKVMKAQGTHEGCIEQVYGLYRDSLYGDSPRMDSEGRLRADDKELDQEVQGRVQQLWHEVTSDNIDEVTDFAGYKSEFLRLFGFGIEGVDYEADVCTDVQIPNVINI